MSNSKLINKKSKSLNIKKAIGQVLVLSISAFFVSTFAFAEEVQEGPSWTNESEGAVVRTSGNSKSESYSIKQKSSKKIDKNTYSVEGSYLKTSSKDRTSGVESETARKWDAGLRFERGLDERWSAILGYKVESDKYAGYQQRHNTDVGAKYIVYKSEHFVSSSEAGYRYVHQNNVDGKQIHSNAARIYVDGEYKINATNSVKAWAEYIPNFDESKDYQLNSEVSLSSALSSVFSLKVAYETRKDNLPVLGAEKIDRKFTTALVAKF